jgi:hypothetical protein
MTSKQISTVPTKVYIDDKYISGIKLDGVPYPDWGTSYSTIKGYFMRDDKGQIALIDAVEDGYSHNIKVDITGNIFMMKAKVSRVQTYEEDQTFMFTAYLEDVEIIKK